MSESVRYSSGNVQERAKKEATERKRNILHLIANYLRTVNLHSTADCLVQEAQLSKTLEVCDNIDLDIILQEYQTYYQIKFQKQAKLTRKISDEVATENESKTKRPRKPVVKRKEPTKEPTSAGEEFQFEIINLSDGQKEQKLTSNEKGDCVYESRLSLKPLCDYEGYSSEWRDFAEQIIKETIPPTLGVTWHDCIGLETAKESLKEAVVYPTIYPHLFTGTLTPWRGILLYGPPGTGKTLLAKILACQNIGPFINVTSSSFVSKWRGESEKMIKILFDIAKFNAPTTIFIDELDAFASPHAETQHEASTRLKSELLVNLDGILCGREKVFVLATTNAPWRLDGALLRRFEKRILVDVPGKTARMEIFKYYLRKNGQTLGMNEMNVLSELTESYSCADVKLVCKEALMTVVREKLMKSGGKIGNADGELRKVTVDDLKAATNKIKPCVNCEMLKKYREWNNKYGYS